MNRRDRVLVGLSLTALAGVAALFGAVAWYAWNQSLAREEGRVELVAKTLGEEVERTIVNARDLLDALNRYEGERCSDEHLSAMQVASIGEAHIRAVGYWEAAERMCGIGFAHGSQLTPPKADRIYDSGVIAWWPGPQTRLAGVEFFLMRYGAHDIAIDPRQLLEHGLAEQGKAGLWVEGLRMASSPWGAELPSPDSLPQGLTVDRDNDRIISRFSRGTIFPIDIVVVEPIETLWGRYLPTIITAGFAGLLLMAVWVYLIFRLSRRHLSVGSELRNAIAAGHIRVHYQPVIDLESRHCIGAEALVRWQHENENLIGPDVFIPIAEREGLISGITRCVLQSIIGDLGELIRNNPGLPVQQAPAGQTIHAFLPRTVPRRF